MLPAQPGDPAGRISIDRADTVPESLDGPIATTHCPTANAARDVASTRVTVVEEVTTTVMGPLATELAGPLDEPAARVLEPSRRTSSALASVNEVLVVAVTRPLALTAARSGCRGAEWVRRAPWPPRRSRPDRTPRAGAGQPAGPAGVMRTLRAVMVRVVVAAPERCPTTSTQSPDLTAARVAASISVNLVDPLKSTVTCPLLGLRTSMLAADTAATVPVVPACAPR